MFIIFTYYLGMVLWIYVVYSFRYTIDKLKDIYLDYAYDNGNINYLTIKSKKTFKSTIINSLLLSLINVFAVIFCLIYESILTMNMYLLVSSPLIALLILLVIYMNFYNETKRKKKKIKKHKNKNKK